MSNCKEKVAESVAFGSAAEPIKETQLVGGISNGE